MTSSDEYSARTGSFGPSRRIWWSVGLDVEISTFAITRMPVSRVARRRSGYPPQEVRHEGIDL
jgi:hypothetical protein